MATIHVEHEVNADADKTWALLADFGNIQSFNPNITKSFLINGSQNQGIGAERQCNLDHKGGYIRERVTDWKPGQSYTIDIYDGALPVKNAVTTLGVKPLGAHRSVAYMTFTYTPKFGPLGQLMNLVMLKPMMTGMLKKVVKGLADKTEDQTEGDFQPHIIAA